MRLDRVTGFVRRPVYETKARDIASDGIQPFIRDIEVSDLFD